MMTYPQMLDRIRTGKGFIAALDQSGGSTPRTLVQYGIPEDTWSGEEQMFALIHQMRSRILTSAAFRPDKVIAAILFERTLEGKVNGQSVSELLHARGIVPFLKIDEGLQPEASGVQLMRPLAALDSRLELARQHGALGTKMRSVIRAAHPAGIAQIVEQQCELGARIAGAGLLPILEPEYDIAASDRAEGEALLKRELLAGLSQLPGDQQVMLKLSIPVQANTYLELAVHPRVARLAGLSGGYTRTQACERLAQNDRMIASFSRALLQDLQVAMTPTQFDAALSQAIDEIYRASVHICA